MEVLFRHQIKTNLLGVRNEKRDTSYPGGRTIRVSLTTEAKRIMKKTVQLSFFEYETLARGQQASCQESKRVFFGYKKVRVGWRRHCCRRGTHGHKEGADQKTTHNQRKRRPYKTDVG
ncbi:MAG: hypothetical protein GY820_17650 [Gammaproteobacteria bacterium]|nr:hypothetical protein [Gammaproteobacteria bacterium]